MRLLAALILGALASSVSFAVGGASCAPFTEAKSADGGALPDGGVVEPAMPRDVRVELGWPTVTALDPGKDLRASTMRVVVTDAVDPSRTVTRELASVESGPFDFPQFNTSNLVDVRTELRSTDDRLIGYGERRRWNLRASGTVPVAVRRRLLYFTSADRDGGQLRVLGLTPPDSAEPAMDEPDLPKLVSLTEPSALYITKDGLLLVQAGRDRLADGGGGSGAIAVLETASHAVAKTIPLGIAPSDMVPLGDGHRLFAAPSGRIQTTVFALVDIDAGVTTDLPSGLMGGAVDVASAAVSVDGAHAVAVGSYTESGRSKPYAFSYDAGANKVSNLDLSLLVDVVDGVRFMPDGNSIVIAGAKSTATGSSGMLLVFDAGAIAASRAPKSTFPLEVDKTHPSSLVVQPDGKLAYVSDDIQYGASSSCCGELRIIDLESGKQIFEGGFSPTGPEYQFRAALQLPYAPNRVLAGQTDEGNNVHGPMLELSADGTKPSDVKVVTSVDIGSIDAMATPFGNRL